MLKDLGIFFYSNQKQFICYWKILFNFIFSSQKRFQKNKLNALKLKDFYQFAPYLVSLEFSFFFFFFNIFFALFSFFNSNFLLINRIIDNPLENEGLKAIEALIKENKKLESIKFFFFSILFWYFWVLTLQFQTRILNCKIGPEGYLGFFRMLLWNLDHFITTLKSIELVSFLSFFFFSFFFFSFFSFFLFFFFFFFFFFFE